MTQDEVKFICNVLREGTIKWSGRSDCLKRARKRVLVRKSKKGLPVYKYHWQCFTCRNWFRDVKAMEVDHIVEVGTEPKTLEELLKWLPRLYCGQDNLAAVCSVCHLKKTMKYNSARSLWKRKTMP